MKWPAFREAYLDEEFKVSLCTLDYMEVPLARALTEHPFANAAGILPFPGNWGFTMEGCSKRDAASTGGYFPRVRVTPPGITVPGFFLVAHGIFSLVEYLVERDLEILDHISYRSTRSLRSSVDLLEMASLKNPNLLSEFILNTLQDRTHSFFALLKTGRETGAIPFESQGTRWFLLMDTFPLEGSFLYLEARQSLEGVEIPRSYLAFQDRSSTMTVFHGQGWSHFPTVGEFLERFQETFQDAILYGTFPYSPGALAHLETRAVIRLPSYNEIKTLEETHIPPPPRGLPPMGYLLDTRAPLVIPQDIPLILDQGEALAILSRTAGIYYAQEAPASLKKHLWVNHLEEERETWVALAVPRLRV